MAIDCSFTVLAPIGGMTVVATRARRRLRPEEMADLAASPLRVMVG